MAGLHRLKVDNGIFLDEKRLYGIREYSVIQNEEDNQATLTIEMDVTILGNGQTNDAIDTKANLAPEKNAKEYVSERVVNIAELESYIERAYISVELLAREIKKSKLNNQQIMRLLKNTREAIGMANDFEFCVERRTTQ